MIVACKISLNYKLLSFKEFNRIINFYKKNNLNYKYNNFLNKKNIGSFLKIMKQDKKFKGNEINLILLKNIGKAIIKKTDLKKSFLPIIK